MSKTKAPVQFLAPNKCNLGFILKIIWVVIFLISTTNAYLFARTTADFFDGFENGSLNWNLEEGWRLTKTGNNTVLEGTGHKWASLKGGVWDNYALTVKFKIIKGAIHFNYRKSDERSGTSRYFIGVSGTDIYLNKQIGNNFYNLAGTSWDLGNEWHKIEIRAYEGLINVYIDDLLYIIYQDEDFIISGGSAFETLEDSVCLLDEVNITGTNIQDVKAKPDPGQINVATGLFVPDTTNTGDLALKNKEVKIIEGLRYLQQGNVYINDQAKLIIRNSQFMLGRGDLPTIHTYINVGAKATLEIEKSTIVPECPANKMGALVVIRNYGNLKITDSPTEIHLLEMYGRARLTMVNSKMVNPIGGLLQVHGGNTKLVNSTIGALGLSVPENAHLNLSQIKSGVYYETWDIRQIIPDANYNLVLEKTNILKDELEPGPYERGWLFFPEPGAHVKIADSELRKVFITLSKENAAFANLKVGKPSSLKYRGLELKNIIMKGQWPFVLNDSNVTISDSDYLFLQPSGRTKLTLINAHMVEFIPREFYGVIDFQNCTWTNAGEIIGGRAYHSTANDFTIRGSLKISPELRKHLQWQDAKVTREYDAVITGNPAEGILIEINGQTYNLDNGGRVKFCLTFDQFNYNQPQKLKVFKENKLIAEKDIDFFANTPILLPYKGTINR